MLPIQFLDRLVDSRIVRSIEYSERLTVELCGNEYFHFSCRLPEVPGGIGFGVSRIPQVAKGKAFMEALERGASQSRGHGTAAHLGVNAAKRGAYQEMIERDSFIRWMLGLSGSERVELSGDVSIVWIPSLDPEIVVTLAAYRGFDCVPFGLGAGQNSELAQERALEELSLSLIRHQVRSCDDDSSLYGRLHANTRSQDFKKKLVEVSDSALSANCGLLSRVKINTQFVTQSGLHRWPIQVVSVGSPNCFRWDLQWFENPTQPEHGNTRLAFASGLHYISPIGVG